MCDREQLRTYPVYDVTSVGNGQTVGLDVGGVGVGVESAAEGAWSGDFAFATAPALPAAEPDAPASPAAPARMPPATVQWLLDHYETAEGTSQVALGGRNTINEPIHFELGYPRLGP